LAYLGFQYSRKTRSPHSIQATLLHGLKAGAKRSTNISKIAAVTQKPEETPTDFYERLCEAFWVYTPFDQEVPENNQMVNTAFAAQSYANIHQKLQKLKVSLE
jgi:hypothetical protein